MVIKKLNSVFSKHSRIFFGIFALLIIVAFMPGLTGGCNQDPGKQQAGTAFGEKVTYHDLAKFGKKVSVAMMMISDGRMAQMPEYDALFQMYCMEKYAERIGLTVSDKEVADMIKTLPVARKDNKFDVEKFDKFTKNAGLNDEDISDAIRLMVVMNKLSLMNNTDKNVSDQEAEAFYRATNNQFTLEICQLDPAKFKVAPPKKDDLQKFYNANKTKFTKDNKQLTFEAALVDVNKEYKQEKQIAEAVKFATENAKKIKEMTDRKAAVKAFADLKKYGTVTTISYPDEKLMQDMNKFMLIYPLLSSLPQLHTGDIEAFMASAGPAFVRVIKRAPSDMSKFAAAKEQIKMQLAQLKQQQSYQRMLAEISKQCKSDIPQKGQAE
ncbi:MAG: SurA N-terminal domain-containing protein [Lentisphaeria bacterium]|nr:SurA N-terminal domain-containing protein [Lentisphaeria bacterium]